MNLYEAVEKLDTIITIVTDMIVIKLNNITSLAMR